MAEPEPVPCNCPGRGIYLRGESTHINALGNNEMAALAAVYGALPANKAEAVEKQETAFNSALRTGDAACKKGEGSCTKCEAWFRKLEIRPPFISKPKEDADGLWSARAFYEWEIEVACRCVAEPD
jgi:hypothetical protein